MRRFIVPPEILDANPVILEGELYRHVSRVLRLGPGDSLILCNGCGKEYSAIIRSADSRSLTIEITGVSDPVAIRTAPVITLIQGLPKGDKFDLIVQKATELGVADIIAFHAARSIVRISSAQAGQRIARWRKIATEAARQSERTDIPNIVLAENLEAALRMGNRSVNLMLWEREKEQRLHGILGGSAAPAGVAVLIGPEGGFTEEEVSVAGVNGFTPVSLGARILRTETAGLAMVAILQYQWGDLG